MCVAKWIQTWQRPKLSTNEVKICHLQHQFLPPSLLTQFCLHPTRWQACYAPPSPLSAPVPRLRLMACGGWCLWVMPQENVFHNLLFLLEKRRKRGEGTQTKQTREEREMVGSKRKWVTSGVYCWRSLCGPIFWQKGGEGYWETQRHKTVHRCSWVYLTLVETEAATKREHARLFFSIMQYIYEHLQHIGPL